MSAGFLRWSEEAYALPARSLGGFRIVYAAMMLVMVLPVGDVVVDLPAGAFAPPPGLAQVFGGFPGPAWYWVTHTLLVGLLTALLLGWRARAVSLALAAVLMAVYARKYSGGKIDHPFLVVLVPLVMSLSAWGRTLSVDAGLHAVKPLLQRERDAAWSARAVALLALGIGLSMTTAGYFKLKSGWLSS